MVQQVMFQLHVAMVRLTVTRIIPKLQQQLQQQGQNYCKSQTQNSLKNIHDTYQMQIDMKNANRLSPFWSSGGNLDTTSNEGSDNDIQDIENEAGDTWLRIYIFKIFC